MNRKHTTLLRLLLILRYTILNLNPNPIPTPNKNYLHSESNDVTDDNRTIIVDEELDDIFVEYRSIFGYF